MLDRGRRRLATRFHRPRGCQGVSVSVSRHRSGRRPRRASARLRLHDLEARCVPATFTVTIPDDDGAGSFRQALVDANATANVGGPDRIEFAIPGAGVQAITLASPLPDVNDPVVIDGYT